jgi:hypothetical protein
MFSVRQVLSKSTTKRSQNLLVLFTPVKESYAGFVDANEAVKKHKRHLLSLTPVLSSSLVFITPAVHALPLSFTLMKHRND